MSESGKPSMLRRLARRLLMASTTLVFVAASAAAVVFGSQFLQTRAEATALPEAADPTPVSARPLSYQDGYTRTRRFAGQIEPGAQIDMSFELAGRLIERPVDEGALIEKGQVVARLDIELLMAEQERLAASKAALAAQLDFAARQFERSTQLREQGFSSVAREDEARAIRDELQNRIIETDAALDAVAIRIEKSVISAPFSGRIGHVSADPGTTLAAGQAVVSLIETGKPQVRVGLPISLEKAALSSVQFDIGGALYAAELLQIRPDIDPQTRTRTALFTLKTDAPVSFGQTATLVLSQQINARGLWISLDALKEGADGAWTVLLADNGIVRNATVEILHIEATQAFVRGSFRNGAMLIDSGAHRIVPGQAVRIENAES